METTRSGRTSASRSFRHARLLLQRLRAVSAGRGRRADREVIGSAGLERDLLIVVCAISAGVHAALTPEHFADGAGPGLGFLAAAVLLASLVVGLTYRPASRITVVGAGAVLAGLLASYACATTTGVPVLHPAAEPVDGLALTTKAIEAVGLLAAVHLLWRGRPVVAVTRHHVKGRLT